MVLSLAELVRDKDARPDKVVGAIQDITQRKRTEQALERYSERLEELVEERTRELREAQERLVRKEKLTVLGQLAGGVAHELRNPLGAIKNAAYFLRLALESPEPEVRDTLDILDKEVAASERIIRALLDYATTKTPVRRETSIDVSVHDVLSRISIPSNVEVVIRTDEHLPLIMADPEQLARVFENLIRNGVQAMPEGGRLVMDAAASGDESVTISISDTGIGIPEERMGRIFEPLYTTKAKGIGLGLALVKMLVEGHGGTIEVESTEMRGTVFTVELPIRGS